MPNLGTRPLENTKEVTASSQSALQRMRRQRQRDTAPEILIRSAVHRRGLRFRVNVRVIPGVRRSADLVFARSRVAVFVDGCFWHCCPLHGTWPKANAAWWREKLEANRERDRQTDLLLTTAGWRCVRVWEHENPEDAAGSIEAVIRTRLTHPQD